MASMEQCTRYEEMRNKKVERNKKMMLMLGLLPERSESDQGKKIFQKQKSEKKCTEQGSTPRRSDRIAAIGRKSYVLAPRSISTNSSITRTIKCDRKPRKEATGNQTVSATKLSRKEEVHKNYKVMEQVENLDGYNTDVSLDSMYAEEVNIEGEQNDTIPESSIDKALYAKGPGTTSASLNFEVAQAQVVATFGNQFQEMFFRALMQSTRALSGPLNVADHIEGSVSTGAVHVNVVEAHAPKTWSDRTYNLVKARCRRETQMMRTSAGEGSDSQKDLPIPENETLQQRAVRNRRLNRLRTKRAKDLTNNRRAFKKQPYVLHVDGMAKARGIHKHIWQAALRGQCRRLDPTMDNINHHPKSVVDSIWEGLEKEWEFEGFSHRAREMFERLATKFMRNMKMQLKYKCQKIVDDSKPNDVNGKHWEKIVNETRKLTKKVSKAEGGYSISKAKVDVQPHAEGDYDLLVHEQGTSHCDVALSQITSACGSGLALTESEDVDAQIHHLEAKLMRLKKSKEVGFKLTSCDGFGEKEAVGRREALQSLDRVSQSIKENVKSRNVELQVVQTEATIEVVEKGYGFQDSLICEEKGKSLCSKEDKIADLCGKSKSIMDDEEPEMDCGNVVRVFAYTRGVKEEIGKGIVMGLASSKFSKKVVPKAWRCIKVTSYTTCGGSKICPFPTGWTEQLKSKSVKEVNGRVILWPDMLLRSL